MSVLTKVPLPTGFFKFLVVCDYVISMCCLKNRSDKVRVSLIHVWFVVSILALFNLEHHYHIHLWKISSLILFLAFSLVPRTKSLRLSKDLLAVSNDKPVRCTGDKPVRCTV